MNYDILSTFYHNFLPQSLALTSASVHWGLPASHRNINVIFNALG